MVKYADYQAISKSSDLVFDKNTGYIISKPTMRHIQLTKTAYDGYSMLSLLLHIYGVNNVINYLVWTSINDKEIENKRHIKAGKLCYTQAQARVGLTLGLDTDTLNRILDIISASGAPSFTSLIDLVGTAAHDFMREKYMEILKAISEEDTLNYDAINAYTELSHRNTTTYTNFTNPFVFSDDKNKIIKIKIV